MANVLVLNAGSGSQKIALYAINSDSELPSSPIWRAGINSTTPGQPEEYFLAQISSLHGSEEIRVPRDLPLVEKVKMLVRASWEGRCAVLEGPSQIDLIGHRVVHGGLEYNAATLLNPRVESAIERLGELAPLHNPPSLAAILACREILGHVPQFAVFDTAFHRTLPEAASTYAGPFEWIEKGIVRYGFHGTSYRYANKRTADLLGREGDEGISPDSLPSGRRLLASCGAWGPLRRHHHGLYPYGRGGDVHTFRSA